MLTMRDMWTRVGSLAASIMFVWAIVQQLVPSGFSRHIERYAHKIIGYVYPYIQITFREYPGDGYERSKTFLVIQRYVAEISSTRAKRLKAEEVVNGSQSLVLSIDDYEEIHDKFQGIKTWWTSSRNIQEKQPMFSYGNIDEKRFYKLTFHRKHRDFITKVYLNHVLDEGKAVAIRNRQRKLYTNYKGAGYGSDKTRWSHIKFDHPATFETLAMEPQKKKDIINDLMTFTESKDYYKKIGKAWKRGYLLYGPPGTGKSTLIAAISNLLEYDIYDLELTSVKDNTSLRKLLIETSIKSIIVIEDIDCSLELTGQRKEKKKDEDEQDKDPIEKVAEADKEKKGSEVTLSGLLNFIDGLWSSCGAERLIIFTTNYVEKLDPALIRRGRMDKHIEMSYCCFEAFKVLARNYLDLESHDLFATISQLMEETNITPADVAEYLMPKSAEEDAQTCLENLIKALERTKEEAKLKAEEEVKLKEEEAKLKAKAEEEVKLKEEEEAKLKAKAEEEVKLKEEKEAKLKAEKESKSKTSTVRQKKSSKCGRK